MGNRSVVLLIISLFCLSSLTPMGGSDEGGSTRGLGLFDEESPAWTDSLDDMSHVYQTVGVEVSGGDAHLSTGETQGWIASSIITPPDEHRYDLVILDVETPGNSYVELSMLDASGEPSEVGFANETITEFKLLRVDPIDPVISVYGLEWRDYPEVRIQMTLHANGSVGNPA